jgi:hypothetical protein
VSTVTRSCLPKLQSGVGTGCGLQFGLSPARLRISRTVSILLFAEGRTYWNIAQSYIL